MVVVKDRALIGSASSPLSGREVTKAMLDSSNALANHYGGDHDRASGSSLVERTVEALASCELNDSALSPAALAPFDQFHMRGLQATVELAEMARIEAGERVIDIGSGLGGPSRYLAATFGCRVHGVDLSPSFVEAATYLAKRAGLDDRLTYECADATRLQHADVGFDLAWTQHVAMNIEDRLGFYSAVFDLLRPGGRFAVYDVVAAEDASVLYPVPWAKTSANSFLLTPGAMRSALERAGFEVSSWLDRSTDCLSWFDQQATAPTNQRQLGQSQPSLNLGLAIGADFPQMAANLGRNLREGRVGVIQSLLVRP